MKRWLFRIGAALVVIGLLVAAGAVFSYLRFVERALEQPQTVLVEKGWGIARIARELETQGVISSGFWFTVMIRLQESDAIRIPAGEYRFETGATPSRLLQQLKSGEVVRYRFSFPEGLTVREVAARLRKEGWHDAEQRLLKDPDLPARFGVTAPSLEGWLFPETYQYVRGDTLDEMIGRMIRQTRKVLEREWAGRAAAITLSPAETLVLASIIEKETGLAQERTRIAAVFHNRLRRQMRLESDPTVIYGIADFNGDLTHRDLATPTPFNTYTMAGLPPTPICNPGAASIHAALHPDQTEELYFVAIGDGRHHFSKTYAEHRAKVQQYQRKGREKDAKP
ncbi:MAG: endolytic transglycosylase MltG [Magnetococcales bacterium]|nr:endolytic transglycosylase MltG [Magnetococcales bacterium]NGZ07210.1 endolytic transglycosylase MltG [Magnetococcales bacterium]